MANSSLSAAKTTKNDEFYTQYADIQKEVNAYIEYDKNVFRDKTVLLPCDDPEQSNFTKFFAQNFERYGLKRLISTSYARSSKKSKYGIDTYPSLFEEESPIYDADKSKSHGRIFILDRTDVTGDGRVDYDDLTWEYLDGDGDFRSDEVKRLRDEADVIVTNPPFSMFREFLAWIVEADKKFLVIGNMNAITYKEVFPLIKDNKIWLGATGFTNDMVFAVPEGTDIAESDRAKAAKLGYVGNFTRLGNSCWFTNLDHGRRHQPLSLMTMADNLKFSRHKEIRGKEAYDHYDNYDAIEVPYTDAIPGDYTECLGVPVSFLDKYCPFQYKIIGATESEGKGFSAGLWNPESGISQATIKGNKVYKRLFIKKLGEERESCQRMIETIVKMGFAPEEVTYYSGIMGVPISFLDKYCPEQFEIMGITKTWFGGATKIYSEQIQVSKGKRSRVTKLNDGAAIKINSESIDTDTYYIVGNAMYTQVYARVLIRKI